MCGELKGNYISCPKDSSNHMLALNYSIYHFIELIKSVCIFLSLPLSVMFAFGESSPQLAVNVWYSKVATCSTFSGGISISHIIILLAPRSLTAPLSFRGTLNFRPSSPFTAKNITMLRIRTPQGTEHRGRI